MAEDFKLTVTPQGSGTAQLQAASAEVATAKRPWDLFTGIVTAVPKAAGVLHEKHLAENNSEELRQGTARAAELLAETSTLSSKDRDNVLTAEYDKIMLGESENSDVHNKAFLSAITPTYFSAKSKAQAEFNMGNASLAVDGLIIPEMLPEGYDKTEGLAWIAKENDVDVAVVRNMYLAKQTDYFAGQIGLQDTPEGVEEIKAKIAENRQSLQSSKFYGSKASDWTSAIKQSDTTLKRAEVEINTKFKRDALGEIAEATGDVSDMYTSYTKPFVELEDSFKRAHGDNAVTYNEKKNAYIAKQKEMDGWRDFMAGTLPGDTHEKIPSGALGKAEWQKKVTEDAIYNFNQGWSEDFVNIAKNDHEMMKETGRTLMATFNTIEDPLVLNQFVNNFKRISHEPGGASALRQTVGDDEYVNIIVTNSLLKSGQATNMKQARDAVAQLKQAGVRPRMSAKYNALKVKLSEKLGTQASSFLETMSVLEANPEWANDSIKDVHDFYDNQVDEIDDIIVDKSMEVQLETQALDPERTQAKVIADLSKKGKPSNIVMIQNQAIAVDQFGVEAEVVDVNQITKSTNDKMKREQNEERQRKLEAKGTLAGDIVTATETGLDVAIGIVPATFAAFGENIGEMIGNVTDRLVGHMGANWEEDTKDVREAFNSFFGMKEDATIEEMEVQKRNVEAFNQEFDDAINALATEDQLPKMNQPTMSAQLQQMYQDTLKANQAKKERMSQLRVANKLKEEQINEAIEEKHEIARPDTTIDTANDPIPVIEETAVPEVPADRGLP